ncbi:uncharacterized protein LOC126988389 isoform X2 [Eriocheir sinensis]|uniref:uncharacterized protein LOC126988389 isoform X2 n=1 Tax=Eriocheir sinensis TaxID=95602 RepID=UPI0021C67195|nr:uncharacterized protein LOC126988389 isoform X2 [Eriocheir sinensis]
MKPHALLAALLTHALTHAAPPTQQTAVPYLPAANAFEYDYSADVEAQERILVQATTQQAVMQPRDPLEEAREMAKLNIMDRILIALGPTFGKELPRLNTDALATVSTPLLNINSSAPCPYKYKRCSSQTFFPTCDIPKNTSPEIWPQRFNLFFNLSSDFGNNLYVINATLRLYKNNSLPLEHPKTLLIRAHYYLKSLTKRRDRKRLVAGVQISSDYLGWVTLPVPGMVKRWKRQRNNHGVLVSVTDVDDTHWDAPKIFVIMDCVSGAVPLPFEVQSEQDRQKYPSLNVRLGSPDDTLDPDLLPESTPRPRQSYNPSALNYSTPLPPYGPTPTMQGDDPQLYEDDYEADLRHEEEKEREVEEEGRAANIAPPHVEIMDLIAREFPLLEEEEEEEEEENEEEGINPHPTNSYPLLHQIHHHHLRQSQRTPPQAPPTTPPPPHHFLPVFTTATPPPPPQDPSTSIPARPQFLRRPQSPPSPPRASLRGPVRKRGIKSRKRNRVGGHRRE